MQTFCELKFALRGVAMVFVFGLSDVMEAPLGFSKIVELYCDPGGPFLERINQGNRCFELIWAALGFDKWAVGGIIGQPGIIEFTF